MCFISFLLGFGKLMGISLFGSSLIAFLLDYCCSSQGGPRPPPGPPSGYSYEFKVNSIYNSHFYGIYLERQRRASLVHIISLYALCTVCRWTLTEIWSSRFQKQNMSLTFLSLGFLVLSERFEIQKRLFRKCFYRILCMKSDLWQVEIWEKFYYYSTKTTFTK